MLWIPLYGQTNQGKTNKLNIDQYDYSKIWTHTDNQVIFGFIGNNHQRIRVKFITVSRDPNDMGLYNITGKTMVKGNICDFTGTITIAAFSKYSKASYGVDNEYKNKVKAQYGLTGLYTFYEDKTQKHVGVFKGSVKTNFYVDRKDQVHYDDIDLNADGFTNNEFVGIWTSYDGKITKICNWGDYRIPNAGSFDHGAGEFGPNTKDVSLGWQSYIDQFKSAEAKKEEQRTWWK
ncbi:hypothetical protein BEL04_04010 [Mucilaginibacter sp. PPCGB 2223]|nr:hypothetical protein BEL04_04010 [Mucilaginibacter sp. PPCGB 2223]